MALKTGEVATPDALVCTVAFPGNVPLAPEAGAVNVTLAPETRLPYASFTVATSGLLNALFTCALWPPPDVAVILAGEPAVFVRPKEVDRLFTDAVTPYGPPAMVFAVKPVEATPEALVCTVAVVTFPGNVPLAPEAGAVKVTLAPETGLPLASVTVATSGLLNALLTWALWPPPDVGVMPAGAPATTVMLNG